MRGKVLVGLILTIIAFGILNKVRIIIFMSMWGMLFWLVIGAVGVYFLWGPIRDFTDKWGD